jgi:hypothetical protein
VVEESFPIHTFINWTGDNDWERNRHRRDCLYNQLSVDLTNDIEQVARSIVTMQDQLNSLESVVLQNESGLDLLTAKKKGFDFSQTQSVVLCKADRNSPRYS